MMNLTNSLTLEYGLSAPAQSGAEIDLSKHKSKGALSGVFFSARFLWRAVWGHFGAPLLVAVGQPRTVCHPVIDLTAWQSFNLHKDKAMNENYRIKAIDLANLGQESLCSLSAIFVAIKEINDKHTQTHKLAVIGQYLSDDWGNTIDCELGDLERAEVSS